MEGRAEIEQINHIENKNIKKRHYKIAYGQSCKVNSAMEFISSYVPLEN